MTATTRRYRIHPPLLLLGAMAAMLLWGFSGCQQTEAPAPTARTIEVQPCSAEIGVVGAECGSLEVFEDRQAGAGRTIDLNIVVLPAAGRDPRPDPLFVLAGGPGQAATDLAEMVQHHMRRIREHRDIVLVDQRGTGDSGGLHCELVDPDSLLYLPEERMLEALQACMEGLDADLRLYTTPLAMDDLDQVRAGLGYDQINLWGGSYGTRAALVYLRRHEDHVRAMVVDGLAPPAILLPLNVGIDGQRALDLLLDDCAGDPGCGAAFTDVRQQLERLLASLGEDTTRVTIQHPRTGETAEVPVTATAVASLLRGALYSSELSVLLPLVIEQASNGNFGPMAALADPWGEIDQALSLGMLFSVLCSEDVPFITAAQREQLGAQDLLGRATLDLYSRVCDFWPRGEVPAGYHDPVVSDKPVLVLSGELDPVTPPRWGEQVARHLVNARHVVVPGAAHGTLQYGCVARLVAEFVDSGETEGLDTDCMESLKRPPFFLSHTGPGLQETP
jgi:pimeloyl-ACP methyl ester carboxylesterase